MARRPKWRLLLPLLLLLHVRRWRAGAGPTVGWDMHARRWPLLCPMLCPLLWSKAPSKRPPSIPGRPVGRKRQRHAVPSFGYEGSEGRSHAAGRCRPFGG